MPVTSRACHHGLYIGNEMELLGVAVFHCGHVWRFKWRRLNRVRCPMICVRYGTRAQAPVRCLSMGGRDDDGRAADMW
jgi:hypothetical protein